MVASGEFRQDLFYRLNVVQLRLPPLRERAEDIPLLVDHFVTRQNLIQAKDLSGVSEDVMQVLMHHPFPGNVRELENVIEYAFILCRQGFIQVEHLPEYLHPEDAALPLARRAGSMTEIKRLAAAEAVRRHGGRRMAACRELGISKDTLRRILDRPTQDEE
jgi:DNA-binding NtrC family response regulator